VSNITIIGKGPSTFGTKVLVDGVAVKGIKKIEILGEVNGQWHAVIHVIAKEIDITDMDSKEVEFVSTNKAAA
jgi:hypothetical protein